MGLHVCVFMCAMAKCGPVGIWSYNFEEFTIAEHIKSVSGQIGRLLDIYVCVL